MGLAIILILVVGIIILILIHVHYIKMNHHVILTRLIIVIGLNHKQFLVDLRQMNDHVTYQMQHVHGPQIHEEHLKIVL